nr:hypothetical protein [Tanacetum cinerariifolium]
MVINLLESSLTHSFDQHLAFFKIIYSFIKKRLDINLTLLQVDCQVSDKSKAGLGYKELIPESFVNSSELLEKQDNKSDKGYHEVLLPLKGNYMPLKRDLRLIDKHFKSESVDVSTVSSSVVTTVDANHKGMFSKEEPKPVKKNSFSPPIIKDWVSESKEEDEPRSVNTACPTRSVNSASAKTNISHTTHSSDKRPFNRKTSFKNSKLNNRVNTVGVNQIQVSNGLGPKKSLTLHLKIGTSSRRNLGEDDASKQGRNLKQRSIFEERDFDVQVMMDVDYELDARLRAEEHR